MVPKYPAAQKKSLLKRGHLCQKKVMNFCIGGQFLYQICMQTRGWTSHTMLKWYWDQQSMHLVFSAWWTSLHKRETFDIKYEGRMPDNQGRRQWPANGRTNMLLLHRPLQRNCQCQWEFEFVSDYILHHSGADHLQSIHTMNDTPSNLTRTRCHVGPKMRLAREIETA